MLMSRVICQTNWNTSFYVVFQSILFGCRCLFPVFFFLLRCGSTLRCLVSAIIATVSGPTRIP
jgi:hypothetical protein